MICLQNGIFRNIDSLNSLNSLNSGITIIPNPADNQIAIHVNGELTGICQISIVNMLGEQTIAEQIVCNVKNKRIDVSVLKPGIYTVKIYNNEIIKTTKLVINR